MRKRAQKGNMIFLVCVISMVMFTAISTLFYLVSEEGQQTGTLVKEIKATYAGEGLSNHIVSLVNRRPWEERFYLEQARLDFATSTGAPHPVWTFSNDEFPFDGSADTRFGRDIEYVGTVKDLDPFLKTYRIYIELTYFDYKLTFSWDKRYERDFLGSLNNENTNLNKEHDAFGADTSSKDEQLERILAEAADTTKVVSPAEADELARIKEDSVEYNSKIGLKPDLVPNTSNPDPTKFVVK